MVLELYDYQREGVKFLAERRRACLADEQGLGKTVQVIAAVNQLRTPVPGGWRILVVCPTVMLWQWQISFERFGTDDLRYQVVEHLDERLDPDATLVICTHRAICEDAWRKQIASRTWNLLVNDECHFYRNPETHRAMSFYGQFGNPRHVPLVARAQRTWVLSGTPMPNDVRDLWSMCWGLWPHLFPSPDNPKRPMSYEEFERRYAIMRKGRYSEQVIGLQNVEELTARLRQNMLRRRVDEVVDLPPLRFDEIALKAELSTMLDALDEFIEGKLEEILKDVGDDIDAAMTALRQFSEFATWRKWTGLAKVQPVLDLLDLEINNGSLKKILVFAHHTDVLRRLEDGLAELSIGTIRIAGDTTPKRRADRVARFQVDPSIKVGLLQIVAGGTGATLTEATETLMVELSFTPGENGQAIKRNYRIGQDRPCRVRYAFLAGTCDEVVVEILRRKTPMIRKVLAHE